MLSTPERSLKLAKLRVRGGINSFTATKEDFITCFEGQGCLSRVSNECLAYMFTILGIRSKIFSPFSCV